MKKLLLIIVLLFAGCGNPCEDQLTEKEQEFVILAVEILLSRNTPLFLIEYELRNNIYFNETCRDYLIDRAMK